MSSAVGDAPHNTRIIVAACLLATAVLGGCGDNKPHQFQSVEEAMEAQYRQYPQFHKVVAAKFAGRVTVDGKPPSANSTLFVILNDPNHPEETAHGKGPKIHAICDHKGNFAFGTHEPQDGAAVGKYVVTFVALHAHPGGVGGRLRGGPERYWQPDELKNLYNDPDRNAKEPKFNVTVEPPGKGDYLFDLTVKGKPRVKTPGPNAVIGKPDNSKDET
jgi:hypothetical protein